MDGGHRNYRYVRCGTAVPAGWRNAPVRNRVFGMDRQGPAPHENPEPGTADGLCNLLGGCGGYILAVWHEPVRCLEPWSHQYCHRDRKSTRLNSSHVRISYAVFCLKKKKKY